MEKLVEFSLVAAMVMPVGAGSPDGRGRHMGRQRRGLEEGGVNGASSAELARRLHEWRRQPHGVIGIEQGRPREGRREERRERDI